MKRDRPSSAHIFITPQNTSKGTAARTGMIPFYIYRQHSRFIRDAAALPLLHAFFPQHFFFPVALLDWLTHGNGWMRNGWWWLL